MKVWSSKIKNEAFLRDFLSSMKRWSSKTKLFYETSFKKQALKLKNMLTRHLASELQCVLAIFQRMLRKYWACHEKVEPRHTNSCNCHAKWSLPCNISATLPQIQRRRVQILRGSTWKSAPTLSIFNDFGFQIALAPQRAANCRRLGQPILRNSRFWKLILRACKETQHFAQFLPAKLPHVLHLRRKTSMLSNIDASTPGGNFQYSQKLDS